MTRSLLPIAAVLAVGCNEFDLVPADELNAGNEDFCAASVALNTRNIPFGELSVGAGEQRTETVIITNASETCDLSISELLIEEDAMASFILGTISSPVLAPGASADLNITYSPTVDFDDQATLIVKTNDPDEPRAAVRLTGSGLAPKLEVDPAEYDFGLPYIGCEFGQTITIRNVGRDDLIVDDALFAPDTLELTWDDRRFNRFTGDPINGEFPWTLKPEEERKVSVFYNPLDTLADGSTITFSTNDPALANGNGYAFQTGNAEIYDRNTDVFEQPLKAKTDILFAVDKSCSMNDDIAAVRANFFFYTSTLQSLNADYRIAIIVQDSGVISGSYDYIDEDLARINGAAEAVAGDMLDGTEGGFTEMAFTLFQNGYEANSHWLRDDAKLNLVGISDEPEQSPDSWANYVSYFQDLKDDPDQVVFHAVGGDYPSGCGGNMGYEGMYQATVMTEGLFLSICEEDWSSQLIKLAEESANDLDTFILSRDPVPETIKVRVNEVTEPDGWNYSEEKNAVVFFEEDIPDGGSIIEIEYIVQSDCDQ
ncbi:MAG: choice-of-anchor D domain-containing protein [Myxococcota bacterium]